MKNTGSRVLKKSVDHVVFFLEVYFGDFELTCKQGK